MIRVKDLSRAEVISCLKDCSRSLCGRCLLHEACMENNTEFNRLMRRAADLLEKGGAGDGKT